MNQAERARDELELRIAELTRANEELKIEISERMRAEDRIRLVLDTTPALIHGCRPDGYVDYLNQSWLRYLGRSSEDQQGWKWTDVIHPEDVEGTTDAWRASLAGGIPLLNESRVRRADGKYRWLLHRAVPLRDERGNIVKWIGSSTDIEDCKQAEAQSKMLIDAIPQQIWSCTSDGIVDNCNARWRSYSGLELEDLRGFNWLTIIHPDDRDRALEAWQESVANGTPHEHEARHRAADGTYRWFLGLGVPLRDAEGCIVRWYGTNTDIEDRKQAEDARRQSEESLSLFRMLIDQSSDSIEVVDPVTLQFLDMNARACADHGYTREEILSRTVFDLDPTLDHDEYLRRNKQLRESGSLIREGVHVRKDGSTFPVETSIRLIQLETRGYIVAVARDITERKWAQDQLRRLSGQLLRLQDEERRRIARDLHDSTGQNLAALKMALGQLSRSIPQSSKAARQHLSESQALVDQSLREVRTLSYLLHPPMLDEAGLEVAIRLHVEGFVKRSGIRVDIEVSASFGRMKLDIELVLFRVIQESLTNIHQHSRSTQATIRLGRNARDVIIEVSDTGHKKSGDRFPFKPGVGISSMQERVKQIGGQLAMESGSRGTTVRAMLPAGFVTHEDASNPEQHPADPSRKKSKAASAASGDSD
jgi:PAS domain S-box-containing protein